MESGTLEEVGVFEPGAAPAAVRRFEGADGLVLENVASEPVRFGSRHDVKQYAKQHGLIIHAVE